MNSLKLPNGTDKFSITFVGISAKVTWPHFIWGILINGEVFEYNTGKGHATPFYSDKYRTKRNAKPTCQTIIDSANSQWIHVPSESDVMECLKSDALAGNESFDSFCDNFGYSNDSLAALDTYRACADTAKRLLKALGHAEFIKLINSDNNT